MTKQWVGENFYSSLREKEYFTLTQCPTRREQMSKDKELLTSVHLHGAFIFSLFPPLYQVKDYSRSHLKNTNVLLWVCIRSLEFEFQMGAHCTWSHRENPLPANKNAFHWRMRSASYGNETQLLELAVGGVGERKRKRSSFHWRPAGPIPILISDSLKQQHPPIDWPKDERMSTSTTLAPCSDSTWLLMQLFTHPSLSHVFHC